MKKRVISFLLVAVMAFGLGAPAYASAGDADAKVDTSNITVEGTNDVGELLANEMRENNVSGAGGNHISGLTVDGSIATVELVTDRAGEVVVAVYDEDGGQMLSSGNASVAAGTETVSVTIEGPVPQYFVATAFLLDAAGHEPLCEEYTTSLYTKEMQDFVDTDVNDYDPDLVLNLDADPSTNFMVYSEKTIVVRENGQTNVLADNGDGTYTVTNADETFTSLSAGDTFSYEQNDGNIKLVKVASVSVDGTTVFVTEDENVDMEDVFDYVKIEVGDGTDDDPSEVATVALEGEGSATVSTISVSYNNSGIKISGSLKTKLGVKIYLSRSWKYIELKATSTLSGSLEVSKKLSDIKIPIGSTGFSPVAGLYVGFEFNFVIKSNVSLKSNFTLKKTYTITWEDGAFRKDTSDPKIEFELNVEGSLFIGLSIEAHLNLISDKILKLGIEVEIGGEIKAALAIYRPDKTSERHACSNCVDGDINAKAEITCSVRIFNSDKWTAKATICSISIKIGDFYYSNDFDEFGWGTCPHISYQITLTVVDENKQPVSGVLIDGTGLEEAPVTNEEGVAEFYLPNGTYEVTVSLGESQTKETIEVKDQPRAITVILSGSFSPAEPSSTPEMTPIPGEVVASGECGAEGDNVQWYLTDDGTLTIYGNGKMEDYYNYYSTSYAAPWYSSREKIKGVVIKDGVTYIGGDAFDGCTSLTSISIPGNVTEIGQYAFYGCTDLASVSIPDGVTEISKSTFGECTNLTSISIPDSVTHIGIYAFYGCTSLASISIPTSVTCIDYGAFKDCTSLASINIPNGVTEISGSTFSRCTGLTTINIPDSVTYIGSSAFYACHSLTTISIPDSMTGIGNDAFASCTSLTTVSIPDSVTEIGDSTFRGCTSLTSISIPDGVTEISDYVFYACTNLTSISIPDGVTSIGSSAFYACHSLTTISIPDSMTYIGSVAFCECTGLTSIDIPDSVTYIGQYAFQDCHSLTSISIPDSVTEIDNSTFCGCTSLTTIIIPEAVTSIGNLAFYWCTNLTLISIPDSVTYIGNGAFEECNSLADVYYSGSPEQWSAIQVAGDNENLTGANIHYNSTGPEDAADAMALVMAAEPEETVQPDETATPSVGSANEPTTVPETTATPGAAAVPELTVAPEPTATPEPAVTPEPSAGPTPGPSPEPTTTPEPTEIAPLRASQEEEDGVVVPVSAFDGTSDGHTALFTGLMPGEDYAVVVAVDLGAAGLLSASNLLYIAQVPADNNGAIALSYIPRIDSAASVRAFGPTCEHVWNGGEVTVDATCTAHGEKMYTCTICGQKKTEPTDALGHLKPEDGSLIKTTKEATCTETGEMEYTCERCQETVTEEIPALGHAWDEGRVTKEPTAGEKGVKTYTCARCGETKTEEIPAKSVPAGDVKTTAAPGTAPDTGDEALLALYAGILVLCLGGLAVIPALKKRVR